MNPKVVPFRRSIKFVNLQKAQLEKREKKIITNIRNERSNITSDSMVIKMIRDCYVNKFDDLDKMDKYHEKQKLPKLIQEEIDHVNTPIFIK